MNTVNFKDEKLKIELMTKKDIEGVFEVEKECFDDYWSKKQFEDELKNKLARYLIAKVDDIIVGYIGVWFVVGEGHITNVAVKKDYRKLGIGHALIKKLIEICKKEKIHSLTLEVRESMSFFTSLPPSALIFSGFKVVDTLCFVCFAPSQ